MRCNYMTSIKILDSFLISKIAAGEVIERPASVVKELIENSIDAGCSEITITIKEGGKDLIEIRDNGKGIAKQDISLAIKRHSTSKINSEVDLANISTMGFRGEALYSIASVSRFSILSRTVNDEFATRISTDGDVDTVNQSEEVLATSGTVIRVQDLFFNFIVRRKFMKKPHIEQGYIQDVVAQYAVAHPEISFIFKADGKEIIHTHSANDYLIPINKVFGSELASSLLNLGVVGRENISVMGYISKPGGHKRNRKFQFLYLNGRRIYSKIIQEAVEEGYGTYLMKGEFPVAFLYLDITADEFDINIHPQKREALFFNEKKLRSTISNAISHCLKTHDLVPKFTPSSFKKRHSQLALPSSDNEILRKEPTPRSQPGFSVHADLHQSELEFSDQEITDQVSKDLIEKRVTKNLINADVKFRGQLGREFILLEDMSNNDIIILDFHAAHERVNLEHLTRIFKQGKMPIQTLLSPFKINSQYIEDQHISLLMKLGFDIRIPKNEISFIEVHSIPKIIANVDLKGFFDLLSNRIDESIFEDQTLKIISVIACHASYRSGDILSFRQIKNLLAELSETENPNICAHGRPTFFRITHHEMLKQVRRI